MSTVMLRNHNMTLSGVEAVGDTYTDQAVVMAGALAALHRDQVTTAHVDRFDGLVLLGDEPGLAWHFTTTLCGYGGTGPRATAEILEIFGFGEQKDLFRQLSYGGDHARASFYK